MSERHKKDGKNGMPASAGKKGFGSDEEPLAERSELDVVRRFLDNMQAAIDDARWRLERISAAPVSDATSARIINITFNGHAPLALPGSNALVLAGEAVPPKPRILIETIDRLKSTPDSDLFGDSTDKEQPVIDLVQPISSGARPRTEPHDKWLWSWSMIKKISKRSYHGGDDDLNAATALDESDLGRLELFMEAKEDWSKLRGFLESLYDFADSPSSRRVFFLEEMQAALKRCSDLCFAIDNVPFDIYAAIAVDFVIKTPHAKYFTGVGVVADVSKEFMDEWVMRMEGYSAGPTSAICAPENALMLPETDDEGVHAPEQRAPAAEVAGAKKTSRWVLPLTGALALSALSFFGGALLRPHIEGRADANAAKIAQVAPVPSSSLQISQPKPVVAFPLPEQKNKENKPQKNQDEKSDAVKKAAEVSQQAKEKPASVPAETKAKAVPLLSPLEVKKEPEKKAEEKAKPVAALVKQPAKVETAGADGNTFDGGKNSAGPKKKKKFVDLDDL